VGAALAAILLLSACTQNEAPSQANEAELARPQAYTVNYPLAYFAERIAGDELEVVFPAPADVDPAFWSPTADTVADYQRADVVLLNGAGYAQWVQRVTLPQSRLVDTSAALTDQLIPLESTVTHTHGPGGDHSHAGTAFTTWLDMSLAASQARTILDALVLLRPESQSEFRENLAALENELAALDDRLKALSDRIGKQPLLFSHPVYQYLIRGYRLNGRSVHWEPDEMPDERQWQELAELLEEHPASLMIWEGKPLDATISRLDGLGIHSIVFEPSGNRPEQGSFVAVMDVNVAALEQAFPDKLAVLGVLIEEGEHKTAFEPVWSNLPDEVGEEIHHEGVEIDIDDLLPLPQTP